MVVRISNMLGSPTSDKRYYINLLFFLGNSFRVHDCWWRHCKEAQLCQKDSVARWGNAILYMNIAKFPSDSMWTSAFQYNNSTKWLHHFKLDQNLLTHLLWKLNISAINILSNKQHSIVVNSFFYANCGNDRVPQSVEKAREQLI